MKLIVPAASLRVASPIKSSGSPSSSVIVAVPVALAFVVVPEVRAAVSVKASDASFTASSISGVRARMLVAIGAKAALVPAIHVAPPSVEISRPGP